MKWVKRKIPRGRLINFNETSYSWLLKKEISINEPCWLLKGKLCKYCVPCSTLNDILINGEILVVQSYFNNFPTVINDPRSFAKNLPICYELISCLYDLKFDLNTNKKSKLIKQM